MDILPKIIGAMTKEEARFYKLFIGRMNKGADRMDETLFDYLRKNADDADENRIFKKLYPEGGSRNNFYRLKNRLTEDLERSLLSQYMFNNEQVYSLNYLALARLFAARNEFKIAGYLLARAEKKAAALEDFDLLDLIYSLYIKLSMEMVSINPEIYIQKRKQNYEQLKLVREIDDLLAAVHYRLKISQNYASRDEDNLQLLQKTVDEFALNPEAQKSVRIRLKIYTAISQTLLQTHDYLTLEAYARKTYQEFLDDKLFTRANHETRLQMLTYIVNASFKNGRFAESLKYADILGQEIEAFDRLLYHKYLFFYYNAQVINYSQLNPDRAIELLDMLEAGDWMKTQPFYQVFVYLNLSLLWFGKGKHKNAIKELTQLYIHDHFKDADPALRFKIALFELMIRFDLQDEEVFDRRAEQIRREFDAQLADNARDAQFLSLIEKLMKTWHNGSRRSLKNAMQEFIAADSPEAADGDIFKYADWLKKKLSEI